MKTRQFIVLLVAIFLQPVICYCWWGYRSQHIAFNQVDRDHFIKLEEKVNHLEEDIQTIYNWETDIYSQLDK